MFEIINNEKKQITISLHLEEIYMEMLLKNHIKTQSRLFSNTTLSKSCIDYLTKQKFDSKEYEDYECIVDFMHIKFLKPNSKNNFLKWLIGLPNVKVIHCDDCDSIEEIKKMGIAINDKNDYRDAFNYYGKKYIVDRCIDQKGYTTQIGIQLDVYIDLKKIINDSIEMLRWCYIIAYDLDSYFTSVGEESGKKNLFFCHTLNGTYIAGILSQLLGYDLVYVDHLGPYNKLNKVDFYKGKSNSEEFIIVADMVCQGNEFLRAKNIVEYLGGTVRGCAGILRLDISSMFSEYGINVFAINLTPEEAKKELGYTIRTKLCAEQCKECKARE